MLDKTYEYIKTKSKTSWRHITQRNLNSPTKIEVYIQHILKEFRSLEKQLRKIHPMQDIKRRIKRTKIPLEEAQYKMCIYKKRDVPRYYRT
jgi:hypothetical protein